MSSRRVLVPALLILLACSDTAYAQAVRGTVVDQTNLPLPGVNLDLRRANATVATAVTAVDGAYEFPTSTSSDRIVLTLQGFETMTVGVGQGSRIVMVVSAAAMTTDVVGSAAATAGVTAEKLGSVMTGAEAQKLAVARPRALEALPLLPSVIRGTDGLLRIDGTRPHESTLLIDGFDVTDPVSGSSAIDLPLEAVKSVSVLRDPMDATYGGTLGALASVETTRGPDAFEFGVQGFLPRPRMSRYGFGRIEGFFPRANIGGRIGRVRFTANEEFDYERIPVPGVTTHTGGPDIHAVSVTSFARVDADLSNRHLLTIETIVVPGHTGAAGLSPLRAIAASPRVASTDVFAGVIDRWILGSRDVLTIRAGVLDHTSGVASSGDATALLTPAGWRANWFSSGSHNAARESASVAWQRAGLRLRGHHTVTISGDVQHRGMRGSLTHRPIDIQDASGVTLRNISFGSSPSIHAADTVVGAVGGDLWEITDRVRVSTGVRIDGYASGRQVVASPRLGVQWWLDADRATVLKVGAGRFVGRTPLDALAFSSFAARTDVTYDDSGVPSDRFLQRMASRRLQLPHADTISVEIERRIRPGLDVQVGVRQRLGGSLATVDVPVSDGDAVLQSDGRSEYRETQLALRQVWNADTQVFVSYVRSSLTGELNDFGSLFSNSDTPLLQPGGRTVGADDVPHRIVGWGTTRLPFHCSIAPAVEWHTGFPYSALDARRHYLGRPNDARYPDFFSLDLVGYRTVTIGSRPINLGLQVFNVTGHFNPRDVMAISESSHGRTFTNSVGRTVGGYMMVKWQ